MDSLQLKMCDIQGRLFELSALQGYDSERFVPLFMSSEVAKNLDSRYNRMQWAGEEYFLEEILALLQRGDQCKNISSGKCKDDETQLYDVSHDGS